MSKHRKNFMHKFLAVVAGSVALFGTVQAMAADSTVTYDIGATCEVAGVLNFTITPASLADVPTNGIQNSFTLICDDPNGSILSLTTENGGLQNSQVPSLSVNYTIRLDASELTGPPVILVTNGTPLASSSQPQQPSADLADPANNNNVTMSFFPEPFPFSGTYTDTVSVNISGNP